jgi:DNA-directed RNA polymerase subunit beta'
MKLYSAKQINILENSLKKLDNLHLSFDYIRISIASPQKIKNWTQKITAKGIIYGEVTSAETLNFRNNFPDPYGLFCQRIFGPIKDWKCECGKYEGLSIKNIDRVCDNCNVDITESRVRRYRMGYIELNCPIAHFWYMKNIPNYFLILLKCFDENLKVSHIEQILYFKMGSEIIDRDNPLSIFFSEKTNLEKVFVKNLILKKLKHKYLKEDSTELPILENVVNQYRKGAEIIKAALENIPLKLELERARSLIYIKSLGDLKKNRIPDKGLIRRIRIFENFLATKTNPAWLILTILPVLPPSLRPLVELESGRLVAADINEIYRLIITRNFRLFDLLYRHSFPDFLSIYARRLLQESVDALIDNSRLPKSKIVLLNNRPLKSLSEILEGKEGRFRHSLLGKRVDYSGRSVIVVNPILRLNQCGLPYEMATELFQPFLINELLKTKSKNPSYNTKLAHSIIKKRKPFIWILLEKLTRKHCILLNRAPTLHRFGIQAFDPIIVLGRAIHLHPLVCTGFNADFDGDQMAVHLPLYDASQLEAKSLMRPSYNVLSPSNGDVILKPTQDIVIGCYYLTIMLSQNLNLITKWFTNPEEAIYAFYQKKIGLHSSILVRHKIDQFLFLIKKNELYVKIQNSYECDYQKITIYKKFVNQKKDLYFITNLGILSTKRVFKENYEITSFFIETTPGRLIFNKNLANIFNKNKERKNIENLLTN